MELELLLHPSVQSVLEYANTERVDKYLAHHTSRGDEGENENEDKEF